jgi:hypothetical protein
MDDESRAATWLFGIDYQFDLDYLTTGIDTNWSDGDLFDFTSGFTTYLTEPSAFLAEPKDSNVNDPVRDDNVTTIKKAMSLTSCCPTGDASETIGLLESEIRAQSGYAAKIVTPHSDLTTPSTRANSSATESRKRSFEDMTTCFPSSTSLMVERRKRPYKPPRRREVALMRKIKPCSRCKARKVSVSISSDFQAFEMLIERQCKFPGPCESCKKAAGNATLARHICIRQSLLDLRFSGFGILTSKLRNI